MNTTAFDSWHHKATISEKEAWSLPVFDNPAK